MGPVVKPPRLRDLRYLGGHPAVPSELDHIDMSFDTSGVHFARRDEQLGAVPWADVVDLSADAVLTSSRMTVPGVWMLGVLAAAFSSGSVVCSCGSRIVEARGSSRWTASP